MASLIPRVAFRSILRQSAPLCSRTSISNACLLTKWRAFTREASSASQVKENTRVEECTNTACPEQLTCDKKEKAQHGPLQCWSCSQFIKQKHDPFFCQSCQVIQPPSQDDFFELFSLPKIFDIDLARLAERYKALQRRIHPDVFTLKSQKEQVFSAIQSSSLNHAYNVLKEPHLRAKYLLQLAGIDIEMDNKPDMELLQEVMEVREAIDEASKPEDLVKLKEQNRKKLEACYKDLSHSFLLHDYAAAKKAVYRLNYYRRIDAEVSERLFKLGETFKR